MRASIIIMKIPEELKAAFQAKCADEYVTASEKMRRFIYDYLNVPEHPEEEAPKAKRRKKRAPNKRSKRTS